MDFWEGLFLGPLWTDSNFAERKHRGFYLVIGSLGAMLLLAYQFIQQLHVIFPWPALAYLAMSLALLLLLPFAAARYHGLFFPLRLGILAAYALQYGLAYAFVVKLLSQLRFFQPGDLLVQISEAVNRLMNDLSGFFAFLGSLQASLAAVLLGGFILFLLFFLIFLLLVSIPLLYFQMMRAMQRLVDRLVLQQFYPERLRF